MNEKEIIGLLIESGLGAFENQIRPLIFPSFQLHLQPESDDAIPLGASKVGGAPDLPDNLAWPKWRGYEQSFIAQINLAEIPLPSPLPSRGLLSFFYALGAMYEEDEDFYTDPKTCRVVFTSAEDLVRLQRTSVPVELASESIMRPNRISFAPRLCVPTSESAYLESIGLSYGAEGYETYWSVFLEQFRERWQPDEYIHRLLGHPDQIQGDMQIHCETLAKGLSWEDLRKADVRRQVIESAVKWRLLLQIDSEEDKIGNMFGDVGRLYFWIHENDLKSERFDRVICEMQCG
ncbi:YwqG family protein [Paenibacillus sp.]|uniref:YwqG family protein n=1 Tax=Paenibacillus sp. TaxID=58172 RepID=UPI002D654F45|nr:YwqG family protein [Paenibacillus sp.]HZG84099.1 YwqG family protein [Paenibacillus sp.]